MCRGCVSGWHIKRQIRAMAADDMTQLVKMVEGFFDGFISQV
jgi:hypothetical protein